MAANPFVKKKKSNPFAERKQQPNPFANKVKGKSLNPFARKQKPYIDPVPQLRKNLDAAQEEYEKLLKKALSPLLPLDKAKIIWDTADKKQFEIISMANRLRKLTNDVAPDEIDIRKWGFGSNDTQRHKKEALKRELAEKKKKEAEEKAKRPPTPFAQKFKRKKGKK